MKLASVKDDILNSLIDYISSVMDNLEDYKGKTEDEGFITYRRYIDKARPIGANNDSCGKGGSQLQAFAEVNLSRLTKGKVCVTTETKVDDENNHYILETYLKEYEANVDIDIIGCDAFDIAAYITDCLDASIEDNRIDPVERAVYYVDHTDIIDVTQLEETVHRDRVTFSVDLVYYSEKTKEILTACKEYDECGNIIIPV